MTNEQLPIFVAKCPECPAWQHSGGFRVVSEAPPNRIAFCLAELRAGVGSPFLSWLVINP